MLTVPSWWWTGLAAGSTDGTAKAALYAALSAVAVALITAVSAIVAQAIRHKDTKTARPNRKVATQLARYEKWFLVNGIDSRQIKDGYEPIEQVRIDHTD